eukprot:3180156-Rhodomonas_salina.6
MALHICYAISGTDVGGATTTSLGSDLQGDITFGVPNYDFGMDGKKIRYNEVVSRPYDLATMRPLVLTSRMLLWRPYVKSSTDLVCPGTATRG